MWNFLVGTSVYFIAGFLLSIIFAAFISSAGKNWSPEARGTAWLIFVTVWPIAIATILLVTIFILVGGWFRSVGNALHRTENAADEKGGGQCDERS